MSETVKIETVLMGGFLKRDVPAMHIIRPEDTMASEKFSTLTNAGIEYLEYDENILRNAINGWIADGSVSDKNVDWDL